MSARRVKLARSRAPSVGRLALGILRDMASGVPLVGRREFPYPYTYKIGGSGMSDLGDDVTANTVAALIEYHLIDAHQPDPMADVTRYTVTAAGRALLENGAPEPDVSQLDWVEGVA